MENQPSPERWKRAADDWVDKDAAARILEETKSLIFAQKCAALGDIPVNKAEQKIKASQDWYDHVAKIVAAKTAANQALTDMKYEEMKVRESMNNDANHRAEARL